MSRDKDLLAALARCDVNPRLPGFCHDLQFRRVADGLAVRLGVPRVRGVKYVVKPAQQSCLLIEHTVGEDTKHLFGKRPLADPIVVVKPRLRPPADVEGGGHVCLCPLHDPAKLLPVVHLFKRQVFHRRAGDNHSVILFVAEVIKGVVEVYKMLLRRVFGLVGVGFHQIHLDLQR